ncbi:MipA/OmpV family protein [Lelliottia nimipressuralis]|uniref:MipA/OmpV family protein n=1 Tax=Lelliottia nimipressuralis TaxID=69220 RepID=UPI00355682A4
MKEKYRISLRRALCVAFLLPWTGSVMQAQAAAPVDEATGTPVAVHPSAAQTGPSLTVGGGLAVNPIYEGSSRYEPFPSLAAKAVLPSDNWGTFTLSFPEGLRWDLPDVSTVGLAFLLGYDPGRKEKIRYLGGNNHHLRGMGDLDSTALVGAEAYLRLPVGRLYVRGMQAASSRDYGGDDLGHTSWLEVGAASSLPLSAALTLDASLYGTWSDSHDMMARFGVTGRQAARSDFSEYHAGGGMRDVTMKTAVTWHLKPQVALQGGLKVYSLVAGARHSPLTDDTVGAGAFLNALYTF